MEPPCARSSTRQPVRRQTRSVSSAGTSSARTPTSSQADGSRYLEVLGDARGATLPELREFDSSEPAAISVNYGVPLLGGVALFLSASLLVLVGRSRRRAPSRLAPDRDA